MDWTRPILLSVKKIICTITFCLSFFASELYVYAGTDLSIICADQGPCETNTKKSLFSETNMYPGETRIQRILVSNEDRDDYCYLSLQTKPSDFIDKDLLAERMFVAITDGIKTYVGQTDLLRAYPHTSHAQLFKRTDSPSLGVINPGEKVTLMWFATLDHTAGNDLQGLQTRFDFSIVLECHPTPPPSPPASSSPIPHAPSPTSNLSVTEKPLQQVLGVTSGDFSTNNFEYSYTEVQPTPGLKSEGKILGVISDRVYNVFNSEIAPMKSFSLEEGSTVHYFVGVLSAGVAAGVIKGMSKRK